MLSFIVPDVEENIIEISDDGPAGARLASRLEVIEHESLLLVVLLGDLGSRKLLQSGLVIAKEAIISFVSMLLDLLGQVVGKLRLEEIEDYDNPVVQHGGVLSQETVDPSAAAAELFHDKEMVEFIPTFGPMDAQPADVVLLSDSLQIMQATDIAEVGHTGDRLKYIKALIRLVLV